MKFFISHSSQDKELVTILIDLLTQGFHIDINEIFCTSMDNSLKLGEDFIKSIKENLRDSEIVLFLITPNYITSKFCIMEMGAAWAYKNNIVPIIVPPLDYSVLNDTPMKTIQSLILNEPNEMFNKFYSHIMVEKKIIPRLNFMQEHELLDKIKYFIEDVKKYINDSLGFDSKDAKIISVAQNGDLEAIKLKQYENTLKMYCNFKPNKFYPIPSNFISCIYQFEPHKDWSLMVPNSILSFECRSKNSSIKNITIEFKYSDNLFKFYEKTFDINKQYAKIEIPINYTHMPKKYLKDIAEVCFVVRPSFVCDYIGEIDIKDLRFQDNKITNK